MFSGMDGVEEEGDRFGNKEMEREDLFIRFVVLSMLGTGIVKECDGLGSSN